MEILILVFCAILAASWLIFRRDDLS